MMFSTLGSASASTADIAARLQSFASELLASRHVRMVSQAVSQVAAPLDSVVNNLLATAQQGDLSLLVGWRREQGGGASRGEGQRRDVLEETGASTSTHTPNLGAQVPGKHQDTQGLEEVALGSTGDVAAADSAVYADGDRQATDIAPAGRLQGDGMGRLRSSPGAVVSARSPDQGQGAVSTIGGSSAAANAPPGLPLTVLGWREGDWQATISAWLGSHPDPAVQERQPGIADDVIAESAVRSDGSTEEGPSTGSGMTAAGRYGEALPCAPHVGQPPVPLYPPGRLLYIELLNDVWSKASPGGAQALEGGTTQSEGAGGWTRGAGWLSGAGGFSVSGSDRDVGSGSMSGWASWAPQYRLIEGHPGARFEQLVLHPMMLADHRTRSYRAAVVRMIVSQRSE